MVFRSVDVSIPLFAPVALGKGAAQDLFFRRAPNARIAAVIERQKFHVSNSAGPRTQRLVHRLICSTLVLGDCRIFHRDSARKENVIFKMNVLMHVALERLQSVVKCAVTVAGISR